MRNQRYSNHRNMKVGMKICGRYWQSWGFHGFNGKQLIFNARSESALEKKMFKESVEHRRVVVPATWFYNNE